MPDTALYNLLADAILVLHVLVVLFVVLGLPVIFIGAIRDWGWVRNFWFRFLHLLAIIIVAAQAWLGKICPLTDIEMQLRRHAGKETYSQSFIQHWLHQLLYYDAPMWVFALIYTLFGLLVLLGWVLVRPYSRKKKASSAR